MRVALALALVSSACALPTSTSTQHQDAAAAARRSAKSAVCVITIATVKGPELGCWLHAAYSRACPAGQPEWAGAGPDGTLIYYDQLRPRVIQDDGQAGAHYAFIGTTPGQTRVGAQTQDGTVTAFADVLIDSNAGCGLVR